MIKRTILVLLFVVMAAYVFASPVDPQRAMQVAKQFVPQSTTVKRAPKRGSQTEPSSSIVYTHMMPGGDRPAFYIVNVDGGSFVLVSADDVAHPVLGYSLTSKWPVSADGSVELPAHIKGFFDDLAAQMETAIESEPNLAPDEEWSTPKTTKRSPSRGTTNLPDSVGPLLTTTWNQGQYYNSLCPEDVNGPDGHAQNGCVATAMAQIIKYWGDSVQIRLRGTHSYDSNYGTLTVDYNNESYDYANMPNELTAESTPEQVTAIAKLMYHCGVATNMSYGATESSAFDMDARAGLINFYSFSPDLSYAERSFFTDADWNGLLRENIASCRPIIYSGHGVGDHSFILDGYKNDDYYHFNFGWGGFADGWYLTNAINPGALNFSSNQTALVGIVPDNTSSIILGQMAGTSTFFVDEPLEFYHLLGHNAYHGSDNAQTFNSTTKFIASDTVVPIVTNLVRYEGDQSVKVFYGLDDDYYMVYPEMNWFPSLESQDGSFSFDYDGYMRYAGFCLRISQKDSYGCIPFFDVTTKVDVNQISLSWKDVINNKWDVEYGEEGFNHGNGVFVSVDTPICAINNLNPYTYYDLYVKPNKSDLWTGPIRVKTDLSYWQDYVDMEPDGIVYNDDGYVLVSTPEQLAWVVRDNSTYEKIKITSDLDMNGHRWKPVNQCNLKETDGNGHSISNLLIRESKSSLLNYIGFWGNYYSFAWSINIHDLFFNNPQITAERSVTRCGVLAGEIRGQVFPHSIVNCGVDKGSIDCVTFSAGGLIGGYEGDMINCYANVSIKNFHENPHTGGLVGDVYGGSIVNCYSASDIIYTPFYCSKGQIVGDVVNGMLRNVYGKQSEYELLPFIQYGEVYDVDSFGDDCQLDNGVFIDDDHYVDLCDALNMKVQSINDSTLRCWNYDDITGYPVLGDFYHVTCKNVTNITAKNVMHDEHYSLMLDWDDSSAISYIIRCKNISDSTDTIKFYNTTTHPYYVDGLNIGAKYEIHIKGINDSSQSGWGNPMILIFDKPYWTDIVTSCPEGYREDTFGNVIISSAEGLSWFASCVNGLNGNEVDRFRNKKVFLYSDVDLGQYRWMPIGYSQSEFINIDQSIEFQGLFEGNGHVISNMYINEEGNYIGFFSRLFQATIKDVTIKDSYIKGRKSVGGLCGSYYNSDLWWDEFNYGNVSFDNCHIESSTIYGINRVGGLLGLYQPDVNNSIIRNCSSSGTVYGGDEFGGLIGFIAQSTNKCVENCFSSANFYHNNEFVNNCGYFGGLIGYLKNAELNNCYTSGAFEIEEKGSWCGSMIGVVDNSHINYLYGTADTLYEPYILSGLSTVQNTCTFAKVDEQLVLKDPIQFSNTTYTDLVDALNAWVDANYTNGKYRHWVADTANVNGGYPIFAPLPNSIVTFQNYDSTILQKDTLNYNSLPVYRGEAPAKEATAQYTYMFKGWTPTIVPVTEDAVYTATYDSIVNKYVITFLNEGNIVLQTDTLEYGTTPSYRGVMPIKESTAMYTYVFIGWSPDITPITSNTIYTAVYDSLVRIYGDVTGNRIVDIQDATIVVNYILGERSDNYLYYMADMNSDDEIDIFDLTAIINVILGRTNFMSPMRSPYGTNAQRDYLARNASLTHPCNLEDVYLRTFNDRIYLSLDNPERFTSFQFDIEVPDGADLNTIELSGSNNTHIVQKAKIGDNLYKVIALSMSSQPLSGLDDEFVNFQLINAANSEVAVRNIIFVTPKGEAHYFNDSSTMTPTIIDQIPIELEETIYDLSGRRINKKVKDLDKGIYIINNEKVIIK